MRAPTGLLALAFWMLGAAHAVACMPDPERQYPNQPADYLAFARATVREAAHVEIVEVRSAAPVTAPEAWDRWLNELGAPGFGDKAAARALHKTNRHKPVGVLFRLTVIERLKGRSPETIVLEGGGAVPRLAPASDDTEFIHVVRKGRRLPFLFLEPVDELDLPVTFIGRNSCSPGQLRLAIGQRYLLFRGRNGRLLQTRNGYALVPLDSGAGARHWLAAVRQAAAAR